SIVWSLLIKVYELNNGKTHYDLSCRYLPRVLHSFPTRRSSDLVARTLGATFNVCPAGERWPDGSLRPAVEDWLAAGAILKNLPRSEEHTSELQSLRQLVCRLLLEKKK